mgnify:CR=1 FL=1
MLQKYLPVFIVFLFGILGCASTETIESTKVAPTEIYQSYIIQGTKNSTNVTATFRVGGPTGSTVDLDAPSKIAHNGKEMEESKPGFMKGTDYHNSESQFVANHKFSYTDSSGKLWENEINLEALEITAKDLNISRATGSAIIFSRPIGKDENVEISLVSEKTPPASSNSNANNKTPEKVYSTRLQVSFDDTQMTAKIEPFSLKNFVDGKANISVTVRKNKTAQQAAKGGSLDFIYESQKVAVNVGN